MQVLSLGDKDLHVVFYCCLAGKNFGAVGGHGAFAAFSVSPAWGIQKDARRAESFHQIRSLAYIMLDISRDDMDQRHGSTGFYFFCPKSPLRNALLYFLPPLSFS